MAEAKKDDPRAGLDKGTLVAVGSISLDGNLYLPGASFEITKAEGIRLLRLGAARLPSAAAPEEPKVEVKQDGEGDGQKPQQPTT